MTVKPAISLDDVVLDAATSIISNLSATLESLGDKGTIAPFAPPLGGRTIGSHATVIEDGSRYVCGIHIGSDKAPLRFEYTLDAHKAYGLPEGTYADGAHGHKQWSVWIGKEEFSIGKVQDNCTMDEPEIQRLLIVVLAAIAARRLRVIQGSPSSVVA